MAKEIMNYASNTMLSALVKKLKKALKPCPFCGCGEIEIDNTHTPSYWCECTQCGCQIGDQHSWTAKDITAHMASINAAVVVWNTRVGR